MGPALTLLSNYLYHGHSASSHERRITLCMGVYVTLYFLYSRYPRCIPYFHLLSLHSSDYVLLIEYVSFLFWMMYVFLASHTILVSILEYQSINQIQLNRLPVVSPSVWLPRLGEMMNLYGDKIFKLKFGGLAFSTYSRCLESSK